VSDPVLLRQVELMAELQDRFNREVAEDWRTVGLPFHRAVWVECAEMLDHFGWKWWKHQDGDAEQVRLELVDVWHFGLSDLLRREVGVAAIAAALASAGRSRPVDAEGVRAAIETLAERSLVTRSFDLDAFAAVMGALGVDGTALYEAYVGKNVLNRFRLAHGYREGTYRKRWGGIEDNVHLAELLRSTDPAREDVLEYLYAQLAARYEAALP
jgi:hypothetical protein